MLMNLNYFQSIERNVHEKSEGESFRDDDSIFDYMGNYYFHHRVNHMGAAIAAPEASITDSLLFRDHS